MKLLFYFSLIVLIFLAISLLFPLYWMFKGSFEMMGFAMKIPPFFLPHNPTIQNYVNIFIQYPVIRWILNSSIVAIFTVGMSVVFSCMAGYAFGKKDFPGKNILFWLLLSTMMIPFHITLIPLFATMKSLGLYDTLPAVFLPSACNAGGMFLARQYMSTLPSDILDAARMDGAGEFKIFTLIVIPISKPLVAALSIFAFVGSWENFLWPLIISGSNSSRTLTVGVATISCAGGAMIDLGIAMSGASLVALPLIIFFFMFQKYFTKGITLGGIKG